MPQTMTSSPAYSALDSAWQLLGVSEIRSAAALTSAAWIALASAAGKGAAVEAVVKAAA